MVGRTAADPQGVGGVLVFQPGKITKFNERGGLGIVAFQMFQCLVESQELRRLLLSRNAVLVQLNAL